MANTKDIKDFTKYPSLSDEDLILGAKISTGGTDAAITVANFKKLVASDVVPQIKEGYWWINGVNTNIVAQGQTPVFRYTSWGLEYKYQYQDDTAYQKLIPFSDLAFTWEDLTPEQKKELEGAQGLSAYQVWLSLEGNAGKSEEDYLTYLRQPATEAAAEVRLAMDGIKTEADAAILSANNAATTANEAAAGVQDGKTPVVVIGTVEDGSTANATMKPAGTDESGNPKTALNLVLPKGKDGEPPVLNFSVLTGDPGSNVQVSQEQTGTTPEGNPIYSVTLTIPRGSQGLPGVGSGNVYVDGTGLIAGEKYLFVPSTSDSTQGSFVEYIEPVIPTKTSELTNDSDYVVDAPIDGKTYGRKSGTWSEVEAEKDVFPLPAALFALDPATATSDEIKTSLGGDEGFDALVNAANAGKIFSLSPVPGNVVYIAAYDLDLSDPLREALHFTISMSGSTITIAIGRSTDKSLYTFQMEATSDADMIVTRLSGSLSQAEVDKVKFAMQEGKYIGVLNDSTNDTVPAFINRLTSDASSNLEIVRFMGRHDNVDNVSSFNLDYSLVGSEGNKINEKYITLQFDFDGDVSSPSSSTFRLTNKGSGTKALMDDGQYKTVVSKLPSAILNLTNDSTSEEIQTAIGGDEEFNRVFEEVKNKGMVQVELESSPLSGSSLVLVGGAIESSGVKQLVLQFFSIYGEYPTITNLAIQCNTETSSYQCVSTSYKLNSPATTTEDGLLSKEDKAKLDDWLGFHEGYNTLTTLSGIPATKSFATATLSAASSISVNETLRPMKVGESIYLSCTPTVAFTQPIPTTGSFRSMSGDSITTTANKPFEMSIAKIADSGVMYSLIIKEKE